MDVQKLLVVLVDAVSPHWFPHQDKEVLVVVELNSSTILPLAKMGSPSPQINRRQAHHHPTSAGLHKAPLNYLDQS